jgi:G protein-coupled receptor Mth (Methuselah protein)
MPENLKANMGQKGRCWVDINKSIELFYVYLPISCILFFNVIFYSFTAYKIQKVQRETSILKDPNSSRHSSLNQEKARLAIDKVFFILDLFLMSHICCIFRFFLYLRLFAVMGVTWMSEIISWHFTGSKISSVSDILNCLQGIFVFALFVMNKRVKKIILKK